MKLTVYFSFLGVFVFYSELDLQCDTISRGSSLCKITLGPENEFYTNQMDPLIQGSVSRATWGTLHLGRGG